MSFQGLISGSECAVPANPLNQVLKHTEGDRSLQQDRVAGPSGSRLHHLPGSSGAAASEHDVAQARQFFDGQTSHPPGPILSGPQPMALHMNGAVQSPPPDLQRAWAEQQRQVGASQAWAAEFDRNGSILAASPLPPQSQTHHQNQYQQQAPTYGGAISTMAGQPFMSSMYTPNAMMGGPALQNYSSTSYKGKGKEIDFEAAFAQFSDQLPSSARIEEVEKDEVGEISDRLDQSTLRDPEFKQVWEQLQNSDVPPPQGDMAKWEAEFQQLMSRERDDGEFDYGEAMKNAWESGLGDYTELSDLNPMKFDEDGYPKLGDYEFEKNNKYLDPSSSSGQSSLEAAKALLEQNGSLSEAALLIEAAIQKGELGEGGYEAWILLGEVRNMDEREEAGMKALLQGVRKAEATGAAGVGMLSLAISFTNENLDRASYATLLRWLQAKFPSHPISEDTQKAVKEHSTWDAHQKLTDLFIDLARTQHSQGVLDADVQIGLGVLFYTQSEYERAKDCFEAALSMRPKDYLLWNRLGSCLSNGNKAEEALGAYREALQLRPTYTRAIYNVGVACLNIGAFKEAAEHLLSAIGMQEATGADTSTQLWFTLRRIFLSMERRDLADQANDNARGKLDMFRREGFDF